MRAYLIIGIIFFLFIPGCGKPQEKKDQIGLIVSSIESTISPEEKENLEKFGESLLREEDVFKKAQIANSIGAFKEKGVPILLKIFDQALGKSESHSATRELIGLTLSQNKEGVAVLTELLKHESFPKRSVALSSLVALRNPETLLSLLEQGFQDTDERIRKYALGGLRSFLQENAVPYLIKGLDDPSFAVRLEAALGLKDLKVKETLPKLKEVFEKDRKASGVKEPVKIGIAGAILALGDDSPYEYLIETVTKQKKKLDDAAKGGQAGKLINFKINDEIVDDLDFLKEALAGRKDKRIIKALIDLLPVDDSLIRYEAIIWLFELTGKRFDFKSDLNSDENKKAIDEWNKWYEENQDTLSGISWEMRRIVWI